MARWPSWRRWGWLLSLLVLWLVVSCDRATNSPPSVAAISLTISAAASTTDVMQKLAPLYTATAPNVTITYNFGASGALQRQIEQGAPADVFISAATKQMDALQEKDLILPETRRNWLANSLVLIVPQTSTIQGFADLPTETVQRIAIGDPESVPAGRYARDVLTTLQLYDTLTPKLVFAKDVRQVLSYVATGNVDVGLVYRTDAQLLADQVRIVATAPPDSHAPIAYPVAVVKASTQPAAATQFVDFLFTPAAQKVYEEFGFQAAIADTP